MTSASSVVVELALGLHLDRRVVGEERVGDLLEVLHVRAEDDRLAEDRRLEDVVAAVIHEAAADEHGRRHLVELRQLADRVEHDDVGARLGVDRQLASAATVTKPASRASRSTSPNRSGWRGASTSSALGMRRLDARERAEDRRLLALASCCRRR